MIFLAQPTYDFKLDARAVQVITAELGKTIRVTDPRAFSLLPFNFNTSWCECLNRRQEFGVDYFMMIHADILPEVGFAQNMLAEIQHSDADILSAVVPFKNDSGITSTALQLPEAIPRRLTLKEVDHLPETFSLQDCEALAPDASHLLVNTGLLIVRLDFVDGLGKDRKRLYFAEKDWLVEENGQLKPRVLSEDWFFSRRAANLGGKVMATRKVKLQHWGGAGYPNYGGWGRETDYA